MSRVLSDREKKKFEDDKRLLREWTAWHAAELAAVLAGEHGELVAELMARLDQLELDSAAALLDFMQRADWSSVSYDARLTALHQINQTIGRLRARNGLPEIDDPIPPRTNAFIAIKSLLFSSNSPAEPAPKFVATDRTDRDA